MCRPGNLSIVMKKIKSKSEFFISLETITENFDFAFSSEPCLTFHKLQKTLFS